ncbi:MAG: thiamine pyrophosphate-dependent enzyme [bacterium]
MKKVMQPDLWSLYRQMLRSRLFEEAVIQLWDEGKISGEMHLGIGEEAIAAGVVAHLRDEDALALDHRGTPPLLMRGIDPVVLLREFLGRSDGLCAGMGGHMHLFSPQHLTVSSAIVGVSGPAAVGFALAAQPLRPGTLAVAFFGEGAMNQGMLMESMNLAVVWKLSVLFVCKDNEWAITTRSPSVTGGKLVDRAKCFKNEAGINMRTMSFAEAIEDALAQAMASDSRIIILGEDVHMLRVNLFVRFGKDRVCATPISESAFVSAAVTAAMVGLRPVVEVMLVDFIGVAMDALLNHAAKIEKFSGGKWKVPLVIRAACGGGYGDGGQHEQSLWGWLAHIPGLAVVVPSIPADAGGLMLSALEHEGPVIYLEHKLLADYWLDYLGAGSRKTVKFNVPPQGAKGSVPDQWKPVPLGKAVTRRDGNDITLVSVGVGVHRALEAAVALEKQGISAGVLDLRTVSPLDKKAICDAVSKTGHLLVVDEDYQNFGLSGELAAIVLEAGIPVKYGRVCTEDTIPYSRDLEDQTIPNTQRIVEASLKLKDYFNHYNLLKGG